MAVPDAHDLALNPAQREVLEVLGAPRETWPRFDADLQHELRAELDAALAPVAPVLAAADRPRWLSKHTLSAVHGCEVRFLADLAAGFSGWSVPLARGAVAHKAIELSVHVRGDPPPFELVDEALARLAENDSGLGDWLRTVSEIERAELRAEAGERVTKFLECWPPLKARWRPVTESRIKADLCDGTILLAGKVDLTLGMAQGNAAGKVLVDLKTGAFAPEHLDDLRFYAVIETLRLGVPPRRVASYYLDAGRFVPGDVNEDVLFAAVARIADGAHLLAALEAGEREPVLRPGPACRWCPRLAECELGQHTLADLDDR
jgi:hypothetical protein